MKARLGEVVVLLFITACGSSSSSSETSPSETEADEASAACTRACERAASVCGVDPVPSGCSLACKLAKYGDAELACIEAAATCDDAQKCGGGQDAGLGRGGNGRIGQTDPTGCAPYLCVCADTTGNVCGTLDTAGTTCLDPTESICRPNCEKRGGFVRLVPATDMLCGF